MNIIDFLSLPLSLPVSPVWDFLICAVIGELAYWFAYSKAGELGATRCERKVLHWIIRVFFYFALWSVICCLIIVAKWCIAHWILSIIIAVLFALLVTTMFVFFKMKVEKVAAN